MNYFELFQIPVSLKVDHKTLKAKFYELSRNSHPDFFVQSSSADQANALEQSTQVNKALGVLQNQDERIKYVLQMKGVLVEDEKYQLPPDFLMEVMELNEAIADVEEAEKINQMQSIKQTIDALQNDIYGPIKNIVENYLDGHETPADMMQLKQYYFQKKYLDRILAAI